MTPLIWTLLVLSQIALVVAQIFLKHGMSRRELPGDPSRGWLTQLILGVAVMTVWFLLWLGLMHSIDLSKLMPLEGLSPILIVGGASIFLKERLHARGWAGVLLICGGVFLVSMS